MTHLRLAGAALAALALAACSQSPPPAAPEPAAKAAPAADPSTLRVPASLAGRIVYGTVELAGMRETLIVSGQVKVDEERVARIGAPVTGRVTEVRGQLGARVQAGEQLAVINSSELGGAQLTWLKAQAQLQLQTRAVERARTLLAADVIGSAELQRREGEYATAEAELRAAADQLRVLGMSRAGIERLAATRQIDSVLPITATIGGVVIERKVTQGQVVQPADALFTVADLSRVWVVADVPESQVRSVKPGKEVRIEISALPDRDIVGRLIYVADTVNPETRTVTVRTEVQNPDRAIKPAMLAGMVIQAEPQRVASIPASAVVRDDNRDRVFVRTGPDTVRMRDVRLGVEDNGRRAVLDGLALGETVVTEGAFHLNNERRQQELGR